MCSLDPHTGWNRSTKGISWPAAAFHLPILLVHERISVYVCANPFCIYNHHEVFVHLQMEKDENYHRQLGGSEHCWIHTDDLISFATG